MSRYRVEWTKPDGTSGVGSWLEHKEAAEATAEVMNTVFTDICHWTVAEGPSSLRLTYSVVNHGDGTAGIPYFTDTVTVEVDSGDPGGEEGEFAEFLLTALKEWYDGARVTKEG